MQPDSGDDDRGCILEAAYHCLAQPHRGAVPVAAILARAGVSTRAFYRHFQSKDELFLAMLRRETDALAERLDRISAEPRGGPVTQLQAWIDAMFAVITDTRARTHFTVIDSDEVRAARGYRATREKAHADRERSLVAILQRGRDDGTFPLAVPEHDAVSINAIVSRVMTHQSFRDVERVNESKACVLDFALRALGADRAALVSR
ncbi:TetR/AcrR family transcriptional regulator [Mycolicibacterium holsaticum]|uniref:TetR/AcrR family transcriptional regulator n=1 Tax=Mycolicibacterium holsaticum TaxID=152142 RepID=UPI001C7E0686|nr:TetR/AcrR family transcriptional regulator [Mycolicibacterium holsaticum]MDA4105938.1 TetR family transcriptional regulator [Mycolicibacterium holsaticum DSM 44478 = JCM 12374]QZA13720.1 TetR/AcrR family transcriptional regulator [Mycolicibacterium holsaticum DSM 44478 = JCM 12374]UNC08817.1 TetR/AcrR family transcriptional regulator [Mycolicibacterium holsaticum DSM 44478 = JCM 12374]